MFYSQILAIVILQFHKIYNELKNGVTRQWSSLFAVVYHPLGGQER